MATQDHIIEINDPQAGEKLRILQAVAALHSCTLEVGRLETRTAPNQGAAVAMETEAKKVRAVVITGTSANARLVVRDYTHALAAIDNALTLHECPASTSKSTWRAHFILGYAAGIAPEGVDLRLGEKQRLASFDLGKFAAVKPAARTAKKATAKKAVKAEQPPAESDEDEAVANAA